MPDEALRPVESAQRPPKPGKKKGDRPTKALPTERITFDKQLNLLRAYAAVSGPGAARALIRDVAKVVRMAPTTVSLANAFFTDIGLLLKADGGFVPSPEIISFNRAYEWNPDSAGHKLAPVIRRAWFSQFLMPRLRYGTITESVAVRDLADAASAGPSYEAQLRILIDYMAVAGVIARDGELIRLGPQAPGAEQATELAAPQGDEEHESQKAKSFNRFFAITTAKPAEGVVQFHVSVKVDMAEFAGWPAERISAFFNGIAQVLAAKSALEAKGATTE